MDKLIIGIDPGSEDRTGYAIYNPTTKKYIALGHCKELDVAGIAQSNGCVLAVVEDANQDGNMRWLSNQVKGKKCTIEKALKIAQDLGKNMRCARVIAQLLKDARIPTAHIAPSERQRADKRNKLFGKLTSVRGYTMPTKTNKGQFQTLTGWVGSSNEHSRDAATMLWGKTEQYWKMRIKTQKIK